MLLSDYKLGLDYIINEVKKKNPKYYNVNSVKENLNGFFQIITLLWYNLKACI